MMPEVHSEPLAWALVADQGRINQQYQSPLYSRIPTEIRHLIFQYAFLAYADPQKLYDANSLYRRPGVTGSRTFSTDLLLTCRKVYTETFKYPYLLNALEYYHTSYECSPPDRLNSRYNEELRGWQSAAIRQVDVIIQQCHLEQLTLQSCINRLSNPQAYHENHSDASPPSDRQLDLQANEGLQVFPPEASNTATSANPKVEQLSIHLGRTDWWTWEDSPFENSASSQFQLALDPALGDGSLDNRPTPRQMKELAEDRQKGRWKGWLRSSWGAQIAEYKDLKKLELVLETFSSKVEQLDALVECAKTWCFPIGGWGHEDSDQASEHSQSDNTKSFRQIGLAEARTCWMSDPPKPFPQIWDSELRFSHVVSSTWISEADSYSYERPNQWIFGKNWAERVNQHQTELRQTRGSAPIGGDASEVQARFRQGIIFTRRQMFHEDTQQSNIMTGGKWGLGDGVGPSKEEKDYARTFVVRRIVFIRQKRV